MFCIHFCILGSRTLQIFLSQPEEAREHPTTYPLDNLDIVLHLQGGGDQEPEEAPDDLCQPQTSPDSSSRHDSSLHYFLQHQVSCWHLWPADSWQNLSPPPPHLMQCFMYWWMQILTRDHKLGAMNYNIVLLSWSWSKYWTKEIIISLFFLNNSEWEFNKVCEYSSIISPVWHMTSHRTWV